jgi:hypothetical protein
MALKGCRSSRAAEMINTVEELVKLYPPPTYLGWLTDESSSTIPWESSAKRVAAARIALHRARSG